MNLTARQQGYTLVELMISVVIGLFIIAGVFQIYLSSRAASNLQDRMSNVQENGRFALFFLQRSIRKAGFPKSTALNPFTDTPSNATCPMAVTTANCASTPVGTCNGAGSTDSDQIAVCYQGTQDCLGQPIPASASSGVVADVFSIKTDTTTGVSQLMCRGYLNGSPLENGAQTLVDGIVNMQVQYGVDDVPVDGYANVYVTANNVTNWDRVVAVRVSLLVSTNSNAAETASGAVIGDTASDAQGYQVLEQSLPSTYLSTGVRGRIYTTTIELRNRTP